MNAQFLNERDLAEWFGGADQIPAACEICDSGKPVIGIAGDEERRGACINCIARAYLHEHQRLDAVMRELLIKLSLCSHVPAAGYGIGGHGSDDALGGSRPPGDTDIERWPWRYDRAENNANRQTVIDDATQELERLTRRSSDIQVVEETLEQLKARIVKVGQGWKAKEVANHFRVWVGIVYQARDEDLRDRDLGYKLPDAPGRQRGTAGKFEPQPDAAARDERIRIHRAEGKQVRAIALLEGVNVSTVKRALGQG